MRLFLILLLTSAPAWAQTSPNGAPSKAVQQEQTQADYARKGHPNSGRPQEQRASVRSKESRAKPPKPKKGEAARRTPEK
jgi:hypothetical protein